MTNFDAPSVAREELIWTLIHYCKQKGITLLGSQLIDAVHQFGGKCEAWSDVDRVVAQLELPPMVMCTSPDPLRLPLITNVSMLGWCVVVQSLGGSDWRVFNAQGSHTVNRDALENNVAELFAGADLNDSEDGNAGKPSTFLGQMVMLRKRYQGTLMEVCAASVVLTLIAMALSLYSMQVYDRVIPTQGLNTLTVLAIGTLVALFFELGMKLARSHLMDSIIVDIDSHLTRFIFQKLLSIRVDQLPASVGSLASQLRSYEQVRAFYTSSTLFVIVDIPVSIIFLITIFSIAGPWLAAVPLLIVLLLLLTGLTYRKRFFNLSTDGVAMANMKTGILVETLEGAETIKSGAGQWKFLQRWLRINAKAIDTDIQMRHNNDGLNYITGLFTQLSYVGIVTVGAVLVVHGDFTTGALVACTILGGRVLAPLAAIPSILVQHAQAKAAIKGLERICALETDTSGVSQPLRPDVLRGDYQLSETRFTYGDLKDAPIALTINDLRIRSGDRVGILGPVGSGKSTLLRILTGMYRPQTGRVLLDGLDMSHIDRQIITDQVGYLQQDTRLFQGTLRDNLLIGLPNLGDQVIYEALKRSMLIHLVTNHPRGLELPIFEGGRGLSGGQRQLVAFTRFLLTQPNIWLLDEPTASMDEELERHCLQILAQEMLDPERTFVVVTHKASLLPLVSRLLVIVGNRVVMDGPRDEVLAKLYKSVPAPTPLHNKHAAGHQPLSVETV
jgi:ATP-binding cassette subfamily C protein LapB